MKGNLKIFGLALAAALTLTAAMAPVGSAQYTSNKEHTILIGGQKSGTNDVFAAGAGFGGITCESATFTGTAVNKSEETQVITPEYSKCKDSFGRTVDVDNSFLTYQFTAPFTNGPVLENTGTHILGSVTLTVTQNGLVVCTVAIQEQTIEAPTYKNLAGGDIEVKTDSEDVVNTTAGGFFNCGIANGKHTEGTYDGTAIIAGQGTDGLTATISVDL